MHVATFSYQSIPRKTALAFLCIVLVMLSCRVAAHEISTAYLQINHVDQNLIEGELTLLPYDLELAVGIDTDLDGQLRWREILQNYAGIVSYLKTHLSISSATEPCLLKFDPQPVLSKIGGNTAIRVGFATTCSTPSLLSYTGFFSVDSGHKALVSIENGEEVNNYVINGPGETVSLLSTQTIGYVVGHFVYQGILHILIGIDHILFLFATLLTVNLTRPAGRWQGRAAKSPIIKDTVLLVTAFTVAHSLTLTVTALGWVAPNGRWVETGIAISVLLTALNNIWPLVTRLAWLTFGFGLLHGMGFASVFGELTQQTENSLLSIASFNVGVELGQLAIVLLLMPVLLLLRKVAWYSRVGMPLCSALIGFIAMNWAWQRW